MLLGFLARLALVWAEQLAAADALAGGPPAAATAAVEEKGEAALSRVSALLAAVAKHSNMASVLFELNFDIFDR